MFLNSLVHVFMYSYYLAAALLAGHEKAKRRYLWWGRYLTMFQMAQFVSMMAQVRPACFFYSGHGNCQAWSSLRLLTMAQAAYTSRYSPYPAFLSRLLFFYMQTLLALFAHFFVRKYALGGRRRAARSADGRASSAALNGGSAHALNGVHKRE